MNFDNLNANDLYFKSNASTVRFDIGATYKFKKDGYPHCHNNSHDLRVGFSIMDIGRLKYTPTKDSQRYRMPASGVASLTMDDLSEEKLKSAFADSRATTEKIKVSLPTTLNLSVDYRIAQPFFVNLSTRFNLTNKNNTYTNWATSTTVSEALATKTPLTVSNAPSPVLSRRCRRAVLDRSVRRPRH